MRCPSCGHSDDKVIDSRSAKDGRAIRRRRECLSCGSRFTTYEYVEAESLLVVKRDGRREPFSRQKLFAGVSKACGKRPIATDAIESLVDAVAAEVQRSAQSEITSMRIGEIVMEELGRLDEIAYVRFASVYRRFKDITQFMEELKTLLRKSSASGEPGSKGQGGAGGEPGPQGAARSESEQGPAGAGRHGEEAGPKGSAGSEGNSGPKGSRGAGAETGRRGPGVPDERTDG